MAVFLFYVIVMLVPVCVNVGLRPQPEPAVECDRGTVPLSPYFRILIIFVVQ